MRVLYVALVAAATLLASGEATTTSDPTKITSAQAMASMDAIQTNRRFLRTQKAIEKYDEEEEERALPNSLATLDDLMKLEDLFKAKNAQVKVKKQLFINKGKALFDRMHEYPKVKKAVFVEIAERPDGKWLKSVWQSYLWQKMLNYDKAEAAILKARPNAS
ncbi:hypothetical protein JG687_00016170 [Phytophthora cactorum]|uniref:RxLR effector protein n=1 Tax=Phytophthora cactorum TaxID=29920 RepID=A0A329SEE7_9STRA|nr:hypothetical protein Pcac1_g704 [Phytophthora cactorum]KAG2807385.1 hypothetical protein PC112_g17422 [Phytophthora cactorum]KAG2833939.1 hypothetical protein PC111_g6046 [Phytophthora cactorum]KAG2845273.1 hypothetical protein PC113_g18233 [Phytophthora cactorum]KAG2910144.1 hypothetical protein PC114_g9872 [Phytophthora cactorum]